MVETSSAHEQVFLTPARVADLLCVCRATVYKLTALGLLDHVRVGARTRIPAAAIEAHLGRRRC